jgi:two-component sensor histidine kinase
VLSADLEPVTGAARKARELVTEGCVRWDVPEAAGPACIVATELVNNVVAHAGTPASVTVGLGPDGDAVHVAVRDHDTTLPQLREAVSTTSYGGRGLLLVDAIAQRWGSTALPDGKVVWAVIPED